MKLYNSVNNIRILNDKKNFISSFAFGNYNNNIVSNINTCIEFSNCQ